MTLTTTSASLFSAYLKMPVMFLLTPVDKNAIVKFAYHRGLIEKEKEIEKICNWFIGEFLPFCIELSYQCVRLKNVKPYSVPTLYDLQLIDYNRYMRKMHHKPYRLYQQGNYVGVTHFIG